MKKVLLALLIFSSVGFARKVTVLSVEKLTDKSEGAFYFPHFSPKGDRVLYSSASYKGLWIYDLASKASRQLNSYSGAGYEPSFTADGESLVFTKDEFRDMKRYSSLVKYDIQKAQENTIEPAVRNLGAVKISGGNLYYTKGGKLSMQSMTKGGSMRTESVTPLVYLQDRQIVVNQGGSERRLEPLGKGIYVWVSLSPDKKGILFTYGNKGTFICDLEGNIKASLGKLNYPSFSPDGSFVLGMNDKDDGNQYTESDLLMVSSDGAERYQLTDTKDQLEMYPEFSPSGDRVVYHTEDGSIYLMNIKISE